MHQNVTVFEIVKKFPHIVRGGGGGQNGLVYNFMCYTLQINFNNILQFKPQFS